MDPKSGRFPALERGPRSKVLRLLIKTIIVLVLLGLVGWWGFSKWKAGQVKTHSHIVSEVQRGSIEDKVSATGVLQPREFVDVGAQVSGQLSRLHVDIGSEVKVNDLLAEVDAEVSAARVEASQAQLRAQRANLAEREVNLLKAQRDLQRQKNLMEEDATTEEAFQNAQTSERTATFQIAALKAQIDQLQAGIRVEQTNLKYSKILSPRAGTVVSITARQGQTLNANQSAPTILRVADLSVMTVQAQVSEADVGRLKNGMTVYFTTLGGKGQRWYGELRKIDPTPTVTNNVVLYNALFDVPNPNRELMTQMTAQVMFVVSEAKDVLYVPFAALSFSPVKGGEKQVDSEDEKRNATVKVVKDDGEIEVRKVVVGVSNRVQAEVLSGLSEGEKVVSGEKSRERPKSASGSGQGQGMGGMQGGMGGGGGRR